MKMLGAILLIFFPKIQKIKNILPSSSFFRSIELPSTNLPMLPTISPGRCASHGADKKEKVQKLQ